MLIGSEFSSCLCRVNAGPRKANRAIMSIVNGPKEGLGNGIKIEPITQ